MVTEHMVSYRLLKVIGIEMHGRDFWTVFTDYRIDSLLDFS